METLAKIDHGEGVRVATNFVDENGMTLQQRREYRQRTVFIDEDGHLTRKGDLAHAAILKQHEAIWRYQDAKLVQETARLVAAMKGASLSAWCAASRIVGIRPGTSFPLRPGDRDPASREV